MEFQKLFFPLIMLLLVAFGTNKALATELAIGDIVRIENLTSTKGQLLNDEVGEITTQEKNNRWGVQIKGEEKPISFNAINLEKQQNTVEQILQHEGKAKKRLLQNFYQLNPNPSKIKISAADDCRLTTFQMMDYFLGKQKSEECMKNYFKTDELKEKWKNQTEIETALKNELLKIETESGRKFLVIQFFPRIELLAKKVELQQRVVANKWDWNQILSGVTHMIFVEKVTKTAGVESQFRIYQSWAKGYDMKLWLSEYGVCGDEFNQEYFTKCREKFGKGKFLTQSEITTFVENIILFNKYNKELKDETKCLNHLKYVEGLIDNEDLIDILRQPEDLIDYYVKNNPDKMSAEILAKAAKGQSECMAWYFPDLIWYPETFLMYQVYQ